MGRDVSAMTSFLLLFPPSSPAVAGPRWLAEGLPDLLA